MIADVKAQTDKNPCQNIRKMARDMNMDKMAVSRAVQADLSMKSSAVMKVQGLMAKQRKNRKKCKVLLNKLKKGNSKIHVFSDEKIFTVDAICMSRTNRYIAKKPKDVSPAMSLPAILDQGELGHGPVQAPACTQGLPCPEHDLWTRKLGVDTSLVTPPDAHRHTCRRS